MAPDSATPMTSRRNTKALPEEGANEATPAKPPKATKKKSVRDKQRIPKEDCASDHVGQPTKQKPQKTEKKKIEKPAIQLQAPIPTSLVRVSPGILGDAEGASGKKQVIALRGQGPHSENGELKKADDFSTKPTKPEQELALGTPKKKQSHGPKKKKPVNKMKTPKPADNSKPMAQTEESESKEDTLPVYRLSHPGGGRFLPIEPVFSKNEQFMFLALPHALRVYSTKTSLLHRIFNVPKSAQDLPPISEKCIVSYCIDPIDENNIYIAIRKGHIFLWNWAEGVLVSKWSTGYSILHLGVCLDVDKVTTTEKESNTDKKVTGKRTIYIVGQFQAQPASKKDNTQSKEPGEGAVQGNVLASAKTTRGEEGSLEKKRDVQEKLTDMLIEKELKKAPWEFIRIDLGPAGNDNAGRLRKLHKISSPATSFKVLAKGTIIVAVSGNTLWIGNKTHLSEEQEKEGDGQQEWGTWRYYTVESEISCMDVSVFEVNSKVDKKAKQADSRTKGYVVVGDVKGHIYLWHNILNLGTHGEKAGDFRRLHWHRNAVASVKISRDGNYLISGGNETVLVLWQIDTGTKSFLPHLTSAIEHIVVSPSGTSYAVRLSDNSAMILSTTELKPKANVAGLQAGFLPVYLPNQPDASMITATDLLREEETNGGCQQTRILPPRVACALHPTQSNQILLAVSSHSTSSLLVTPEAAAAEPCPYLQTYDIFSDRPVAKQALTRTHATNVKVGPSGNTLVEPNVRLLSISKNGEWLASLDEWSPPIQDVYDHALLDPNSPMQGGREVFLKFWRRNNAYWELVTRVDSPHPHFTTTTFNGGAKVLDLVALSSLKNPGFASLGADGCVRIWKPRVRTRGGVVVKHKDLEKGGVKSGEDIVQVNWGCRKVIDFLKGDAIAPTPVFGGVLAVSNDGSVLAIAVNVAPATTPLTTPQAVSQTRNAIYILDPASGITLHTLLGLQSGVVSSLRIIDRYLVILGTNKLIIFDLVRGRVRWELPITYLVQRAEIPRPEDLFMDADFTKGTIAVGVNFQLYDDVVEDKLFDRKEDNIHCRWGSVLSVFDVSYTNPVPVFRAVKEGVAITALKAVPSSPMDSQEGSTSSTTTVESGYLYLDSFARVNYLIPSTVAVTLSASLVPSTSPSATPLQGLSAVYAAPPPITPSEDEEMAEEDDLDIRAPISAEMLSNVLFSHTGATSGDNGVRESMQQMYGLMDLAEVFDKVVGLYARPPLRGEKAEGEGGMV